MYTEAGRPRRLRYLVFCLDHILLGVCLLYNVRTAVRSCKAQVDVEVKSVLSTHINDAFFC